MQNHMVAMGIYQPFPLDMQGRQGLGELCRNCDGTDKRQN